MQSSETKLNTEDRILVKLNDVAIAFSERAAEHGLEVSRVVHENIAGDLHESDFGDGVVAIGVADVGVVFVDHDREVTFRVDLVLSGVLLEVNRRLTIQSSVTYCNCRHRDIVCRRQRWLLVGWRLWVVDCGGN